MPHTGILAMTRLEGCDSTVTSDQQQGGCTSMKSKGGRGPNFCIPVAGGAAGRTVMDDLLAALNRGSSATLFPQVQKSTPTTRHALLISRWRCAVFHYLSFPLPPALSTPSRARALSDFSMRLLTSLHAATLAAVWYLQKPGAKSLRYSTRSPVTSFMLIPSPTVSLSDAPSPMFWWYSSSMPMIWPRSVSVCVSTHYTRKCAEKEKGKEGGRGTQMPFLHSSTFHPPNPLTDSK